MMLARAIHFDESDRNIFHLPARTGEWCVSGGFEFSNWSDADLAGKARQAFSNGWLGLETFGRVTFVAVTQIEPRERQVLVTALAEHFISLYGAPSIRAASEVAETEIQFMTAFCDDHPANTVLTVARELTESGVKESFRIIAPQDAGLAQFAVHGSLEAGAGRDDDSTL